MYFIWYIIIGIIAGFVAGKLMRGGGFGLFINLLVGFFGGVWVFLLIYGWYCWRCSGRLGIQFVWYCSNRYYGQSCNLYCGSYIFVVDCFFAQEV